MRGGMTAEKARPYYNDLLMAAANFSSVRALIFDLDGTLIDSKLDLIRSVNAMLHEMGREQLHEDTISGYIGHGAPQLVGQALARKIRDFRNTEGLAMVQFRYRRGFETK